MQIVEKRLGIPGDYQWKAIRSSNFLQANWHNNKLVVLEKVINDTRASAVLDLGCGSGNFELTFAKTLKQITALDYNDEAISFLRGKLKAKRIKNVKLVVSDLKTLPPSTKVGKFDLIIMIDVIEHLKMKDAENLVSNFKKYLNKDGHVCIVTPNYQSPWVLIEKIMDKFSRFPHLENEQHLAKFTKENLGKIFKKAKYIPTYFGTFNLLANLFVSKSLSALVTKLELSSGNGFGNLIVYVFQKS